MVAAFSTAIIGPSSPRAWPMGGVLAEMVETDQQAALGRPPGDRHRLVGGLPGHEPIDHLGGDRRPGQQRLGPLVAGESEQRTTEHGPTLTAASDRPRARWPLRRRPPRRTA